MDKTLLIFLSILATGTNLNEASTIITFPTSFTSSEHEKIDPLNVKNFFQKVREKNFFFFCYFYEGTKNKRKRSQYRARMDE